MDPLRVNICYRPLRIGWAIMSNDFEAFRKAVRYSYALWGGKFNPIIFVDKEDDASQLIDLFRVDVIVPIGGSDEVKEFPEKYPYLIKPYFRDSIFMKGDGSYRSSANALDIENTLSYLYDKPVWKEVKETGVRTYSWDEDDPLADMLLSQLGGYPDKDEVGTDYLGMLNHISDSTDISLDSTEPIHTSILKHPGIPFLSCYDIKQHYCIDPGWKSPGFYVGSVNNLDDLVCYWNLRACGISLLFIDPQYLERYSELLPAWEEAMNNKVASYRHEWDRRIAVWTLMDDLDKACKPFGDSELTRYGVTDGTWNGLNVRAPMMYFGETSTLGVMSSENANPKVSFALTDKPFCSEHYFCDQLLVASVSFLGGLYGDEQNTFNAPYIPELNEFYARTMHFEYNKLRAEPQRIGIVIDAVDHDSFLNALPVADLMERIFEMAEYKAELSHAGLITKQLIMQLGGLQGGRVFKIPGVRRLLDECNIRNSITKGKANCLLNTKASGHSESKHANNDHLYIDGKLVGRDLASKDIFVHLVKKGLFRIGADLVCPACQINSWIPLDNLKHEITCDLCGHEYNTSKILADSNEWHYRKSGVFNVQEKAQGAVPVCLTLQQLDANYNGASNEGMYIPSMNLFPKNEVGGNPCETDFVWLIPGRYPEKTAVILAECKNKGPITAQDVLNLNKVADAFPKKRFEIFVLLSQISPFTDDEVNIAKTLNSDHRHRAILLSANELDPYYIKTQIENDSRRELRWNSPKEMAYSTAQLYFESKGNDSGDKTAT